MSIDVNINTAVQYEYAYMSIDVNINTAVQCEYAYMSIDVNINTAVQYEYAYMSIDNNNTVEPLNACGYISDTNYEGGGGTIDVSGILVSKHAWGHAPKENFILNRCLVHTNYRGGTFDASRMVVVNMPGDMPPRKTIYN